MLGDGAIRMAYARHALDIDPWCEAAIQPASVDLHLDSKFRRMVRTLDEVSVENIQPHSTLLDANDWNGDITIAPSEFILVCTKEIVSLSKLIAAKVEGKSSLARLGLLVHITAGFIDPGFTGQVTLEIVNLAPWTIRLKAGMRICQMAFDEVHGVTAGYSGNYTDQDGPTESRFKFRTD